MIIPYITTYNATLALTVFNGLISSLNIYPFFTTRLWPSIMDNVVTTVYTFSYESIIKANRISENEFPQYFLYGAGSSAYQVEGGFNISSKDLSMWDIYTHMPKNNIVDHSNGDVADDSYRLYAKDVSLIKELHGNSYRFSLSWTRILPTGTVNKINVEGVQYYNNLINEVITNNLTPVVSMYQYDYPYQLHLSGGWTNSESVIWFSEYAKLLFQLFGDRVKYWITFNKPEQMCARGYGGIEGTIKPGTDDYVCGRNVLLAHAKVYDMYNELYRIEQKGSIGIALNMDWFEPLDADSIEDNEAVLRSFAFTNEWFLSPLITGDYPYLMKTHVNQLSMKEGSEHSRLPPLGQNNSIQGKMDFIGIDYFTTIRVTSSKNMSLFLDKTRYDVFHRGADVQAIFVRNKTDELTQDTPQGLSQILRHLNFQYVLPPIYITGNGYADNGELNDVKRINYLYHHIAEIMQLLKEGIDIRGYFIWSLLDSFEWLNGYTAKYGLYSVDFTDQNRIRRPKESRDAIRKIFAARKLLPLDVILHKFFF